MKHRINAQCRKGYQSRVYLQGIMEISLKQGNYAALHSTTGAFHAKIFYRWAGEHMLLQPFNPQ
ncbi:MAG TPA: hypothetical protein VFV68_04010 [Agriterribacter sp.]|nr:hypothetical protein [Agriterribacter sp.]